MREFGNFLKTGEVRRQGKNESLANALIKSSEKSLKNIQRIKVDELNAESVVSEVYDLIRELIEAKLSLEGYKSYSHEATIFFLKNFSFNDFEINFLDNLRKVRNKIKYYGKEINTEEALKIIDFMNLILPKLRRLLKDVN